MEETKGKCKHGEFDLMKGCPKCIAEFRALDERRLAGIKPEQDEMIDTDCMSCVFYLYELDTNWSECQHPDYDPEKPDTCPGYYSKRDAAEDAKLLKAEKG